jgi:ABC-type phosphate transport system substrate-binding protein
MKMRRSLACLLFALSVASAGASAQVVVVVGAKSAISPMSKEQLTAAFMGKIAGIEPVDLLEDNPVREHFYAKDIGKSASQIKSHWAKLSFTGKGAPPKEYPSSAEVKKALAENLYAIGYIEKAAVDASVKIVYEGR